MDDYAKAVREVRAAIERLERWEHAENVHVRVRETIGILRVCASALRPPAIDVALPRAEDAQLEQLREAQRERVAQLRADNAQARAQVEVMWLALVQVSTGRDAFESTIRYVASIADSVLQLELERSAAAMNDEHSAMVRAERGRIFEEIMRRRSPPLCPRINPHGVRDAFAGFAEGKRAPKGSWKRQGLIERLCRACGMARVTEEHVKNALRQR